MNKLSLRRAAPEPAPPASVAPATPRFGERPTVAGVVRRRLLQAGRATARAGRSLTATSRAAGATLPCGHPADQPHERFHSFRPTGQRPLARVF